MNHLNIGIDGYNLAMPNGTGVATYGFTLARVLHDAGCRIEGVFGIDAGGDPAMREILFVERFGHETQRTRKDHKLLARRLSRATWQPFHSVRAQDVPLTDRTDLRPLANRLPPFHRIVTSANLFDVAHRHFRARGRFLPLRMANPPQIMHWTYPVPIELLGSRNVYTLHDIVPLRMPFTTLDTKKDYHALLRRCIDRAAHICTVSEASRADIIAEFGIDPARISNTYQASPMAEANDDPAEDAAAIEGIFGLKAQGYFLYFGAIEPKKNVGRLIEAYLSLSCDTPLVMVGGRSWRSEEELRLLPQGEEVETEHGRKLAKRIIRLDHLPRPLLRRLIRNARAVTFPSIYEGFGLPVLEAMQLGTPVLTSSISALREIAGDAALLVDPYDVQMIAAGLRALDGDAALRANLAAAGPVRAAHFSRDRYRERIEATYARVMSQMT